MIGVANPVLFMMRRLCSPYKPPIVFEIVGCCLGILPFRRFLLCFAVMESKLVVTCGERESMSRYELHFRRYLAAACEIFFIAIRYTLEEDSI